MPGQRKRKRRTGSRATPDAGRWEVVVETSDQAEMRTRIRQLQDAGVDSSKLRLDTLCGRLRHPTGYRLSRFMADPEPEQEP
ncbi:MAG: hypothetical protein LBV60_12205 [Streptomyces sp.]|jgi:hypothetical protein|nr:hypothetical protein [Streptomyces sp.]